MFTELRTALVTDLTTGELTVYDTWPDLFTPPGVLIIPARAGYITKGQLRGEFEVNMDLVIVIKHGKADEEQAEIDSLIEAVLINASDWAFRGVDAISLIKIQGQDFPATVVHIAKQDKLF